METVARKNLDYFDEHTHGMKIKRLGMGAMVLAMSKLLGNGEEEKHDISGYLLVKSEGKWSIATHPWDQSPEDKPVPEDLR